jgi:hypothetical protein
MLVLLTAQKVSLGASKIAYASGARIDEAEEAQNN